MSDPAMKDPVAVLVDPHPLLDAAIFETIFPAPLGDLPTQGWLADLLQTSSTAPLASSDEVRKTVRDLLRHGGYKPTGRGKPASEYLLRAAGAGELAPINLAVDACNAVSLHSGLPISVVDLDLAHPPFRISVAPPEAEYVFNASGQVMKIGGLLCLHDAEGPCANAVKDSQRTKTSAATRSTLSIVWGTHALAGRTAVAAAWYRDLLARAGAQTWEASAVSASGPAGSG